MNEDRPPPLLAAALAWTRRRLATAGIPTAALEARLLVGRAAGIRPDGLVAPRADAPLSAEAAARLADLVGRRLAREPVAYILGEKEFWSLPFTVDRSTLIPRPDSETLIEAALGFIGSGGGRPRRVLDLGTGSGCLLLALLHALPTATGVGVDICADALRIARANADRLGLGSRSAFVCGDWAEAIAGRFDIILANPPYVAASEWPALAPEIRVWEPRRALLAEAEGLAAYRRLLPAAARLLAPDGAAFLEMGDTQASPIARLAAEAGFPRVDVVRDLAGIARCVQITAADGAVAKKGLGSPALPV